MFIDRKFACLSCSNIKVYYLKSKIKSTFEKKYINHYKYNINNKYIQIQNKPYHINISFSYLFKSKDLLSGAYIFTCLGVKIILHPLLSTNRNFKFYETYENIKDRNYTVKYTIHGLKVKSNQEKKLYTEIYIEAMYLVLI